jgi:protein TonB
VQHQIKYPEEALKNNIEGYCKVGAYLDERGILTKTEMMEDIGYGCGEEALRIVKNLPIIEPAEKS